MIMIRSKLWRRSRPAPCWRNSVTFKLGVNSDKGRMIQLGGVARRMAGTHRLAPVVCEALKFVGLMC